MMPAGEEDGILTIDGFSIRHREFGTLIVMQGCSVPLSLIGFDFCVLVLVLGLCSCSLVCRIVWCLASGFDYAYCTQSLWSFSLSIQ